MPPEVRDPARRNGRIIPDDGDTPSSALPARSDRGVAAFGALVEAPSLAPGYHPRCHVAGRGSNTPFPCPTKEGWIGMQGRTVLLFTWMILAVLLVGSLPAEARQLAKVEAERAKVGTWGAVVNDASASRGKAVRWNKPATTGTVNFTIGEPAESATVYIKAGSKSSSRVCVRPKVDGVALGTQPLCVGAKQGSYVGRTFAANLAAGSHTLTLTGSEISGTDRLFADYTSFDTSTSGTPDPYPNPDTTSQTFGEGWTPAAGSVHPV